jgi:cytochrome oxidase Cu insertion factor (SCO1/SenC/PrrC family)
MSRPSASLHAMRAPLLALAVLAAGCDRDTAAAASLASASASVSAVASASASTSAAPSASARERPPEWKMMANVWHEGDAIPNFELTDQAGKSFRMSRLANGYVLLGFIFTTCSVPKACALTTQKMLEVGKLWTEKQKAGKTGDRELHLLTVTIDPENDTPDVLASYSELLRKDVPAWTFATGPEELMQQVLPSMFGVRARKEQGSIAHTIKAGLLRPGLRVEKQWKNNSFTAKEIVEMVLRS